MRWNTGGQRWSPGCKEGRTALHSLFSPERAEHPASQNNSYSGQTFSVQTHYNNYIPLLGLIGFQLHIFYQNYSEENCYRKKCWEISLLKQKATFHCASLGVLLDWNVNNLTRIHHDLEASATLVNACLPRPPPYTLPSVKLSNHWTKQINVKCSAFNLVIQGILTNYLS